MKYSAILFDWGDTLTALQGDMPIPLPWISDMIRKLYKHSYRLGIITNTYRYQDGWFVRNNLAKLDILQYFEVFISSATYGYHKPDARIFLKASNFLEVPCNKILMVGDSANCDGAAKDVGMDFMKVSKLENWQPRLFTALEDTFSSNRMLSHISEYENVSEGVIKLKMVHLSEPLKIGNHVLVGGVEHVVTKAPTITRVDILNLQRRKELIELGVRPV